MNKIYKTICNKTKRCLSVVSELTKLHGSGCGAVVETAVKKLAILMAMFMTVLPQQATGKGNDVYVQGHDTILAAGEYVGSFLAVITKGMEIILVIWILTLRNMKTITMQPPIRLLLQGKNKG